MTEKKIRSRGSLVTRLSLAPYSFWAVLFIVVPLLFNTCPCEVTAKLLRDAYEAHLQFEHEEN